VGRPCLHACERHGTSLSLTTLDQQDSELPCTRYGFYPRAFLRPLGCTSQSASHSYYLGELAVLLRAYRRAVREVALLRERSIHVRAVSFNINAFSSRNPCLSFAFFPTMLDNLLCCCRWMYLFRTTPRLIRPGQGTRASRVLIGGRRSSPILQAVAWDRPSVGLHARLLESADTRQGGRAQVRSARRRQPLCAATCFWAFGTAAGAQHARPPPRRPAGVQQCKPADRRDVGIDP